MRNVFILLLFAVSSYGQAVNEKVAAAVARAKTDTFMVFDPGEGYVIHPDSCKWDGPRYLLYVKGGQYYMQKFMTCGEFALLLIDPENPLTYYIAHQQKIGQEEIKSPESKPDRKGMVQMLQVDHQVYYQVDIQLGAQQTHLGVGDYYLHNKYVYRKIKNKYYRYNQHSKTKALLDQLIKIIS